MFISHRRSIFRMAADAGDSWDIIQKWLWRKGNQLALATLMVA
jgi:hypothetical protein